MNDQRSTTDQLRDAVGLCDERGLYDAADFIRWHVEDTDRRMGALGRLFEAAAVTDDPDAPTTVAAPERGGKEEA